jgi:hypothetical protein
MTWLNKIGSLEQMDQIWYKIAHFPIISGWSDTPGPWHMIIIAGIADKILLEERSGGTTSTEALIYRYVSGLTNTCQWQSP